MKRDDDRRNARGVTRRGFLGTAGAGAVAAVVGGSGTAEAVPDVTSPGQMLELGLQVNGMLRRVLVEPRWSLLFVLREKLGLTGTKVGCERGECGACTVLVDGSPRYACLTLAVEAEGHQITTVEGLMDGEKLGPVQEAFVEHDAFQCGYCTPGQVMAAEGLLRLETHPSMEQIREGMSGNICRCGAYANITRAVEAAAAKKGGTR